MNDLYEIFKANNTICTDTRTAKPGALFFALKGENFNGNSFAFQAIEKGCSYAVIDDPKFKKDERFILVNDVLKALQELAAFHRKQLNIPFIGITGSNGKTTTKELIFSVLKQKFKTFATLGNLNNHIGVALSILSVKADTEIAIIEMGANHIGEIEFLSSLTKPDYGIITNIGKAHLDGFGGIEGVKKGKGELFEYIREHKGKIFLNADTGLIVEMSADIASITYGSLDSCYVSGSFLAADPYVRLNWRCKAKGIENQILESTLIGTYNYPNILAAICVGVFFDVQSEKINHAIKNYIPTNNRSQLIETKANSIVLDAYNANPSSMEESIKNFAAMKGEKKVYILGDMLELGNDTEREHQHIIDLLEKLNPNRVFLVGQHFSNTKNSFESFSNSEELKDYLKTQNILNSTILIKGSRGIKLEKAVETL
ncbi:MAG: UDP-N-acetylmuramoyl-tripeptide--D-alanyl-D-alanine ligase [Bacteroidetes bacterium]|nr:UDP-N-acetylmuramoyl-tripeptide--D-alanyl-D-alanine ligase [Bacteroidota bacterium]HET6245984.1 UDP-N-acetylmuramoyl-tripeptide--D-alanyl-D-alanine ligase [Bacteroidia bacterium]